MSLTPAMIDAMLAAGCTAEQIAAVVKASLADGEAKAAEKREKDAARQRRSRENRGLSRNVTVTPRDERDPPNDIYSNPPVIPQDETIVSSPPKPVRNRKSAGMVPLPDDWEPELTPAAQEIVDRWPPGWLETQVAKFRDHATDKGRRSKDWQAAFRTWITKADEWQTQETRNGQQRNDHRQSGANRHQRGDGFLNALREAADRQAADPFAGNC